MFHLSITWVLAAFIQKACCPRIEPEDTEKPEKRREWLHLLWEGEGMTEESFLSGDAFKTTEPWSVHREKNK